MSRPAVPVSSHVGLAAPNSLLVLHTQPPAACGTRSIRDVSLKSTIQQLTALKSAIFNSCSPTERHSFTMSAETLWERLTVFQKRHSDSMLPIGRRTGATPFTRRSL